MIFFVMFLLALGVGYFLWTIYTHHNARKVYERGVAEAYAQAKKEKEALPDPERDLSEKEVDDAVTKLRRIGRPE